MVWNRLLLYKNPLQHGLFLLQQVKDELNSDKNDAIIDGQEFACQKCGLKAIGPLSYHSGQTAFAWGTFLFALTGIFCFLPCVNNGCKDTHVSCARCGFKRAIIKANCCC